MSDASYQTRRGEVENYFDRTAAQTWARLTSNAPVSRIRATVRAGRDRMRTILLSWLPMDLNGVRILDAGCGTGALAVEAALRGADVTAVDLSPTLIEIATTRLPKTLGAGRIQLLSGDMLCRSLGVFDHVVAMDSLIHYRAADSIRIVSELAERTSKSILFTFAPKTPALSAMHLAGKFFPRGDRAPSIEPIAEETLRSLISEKPELGRWSVNRSSRVASGFYTSQAMEFIKC